MKVSTVLKESLTLLTEKGWCKGYMALDINQVPTLPTSEKAITFCPLGAIYKVLGVGAVELFVSGAYRALQPENGTVSQFNDDPETTFADIEVMFTKAIALAEEDERTI